MRFIGGHRTDLPTQTKHPKNAHHRPPHIPPPLARLRPRLGLEPHAKRRPDTSLPRRRPRRSTGARPLTLTLALNDANTNAYAPHPTPRPPPGRSRRRRSRQRRRSSSARGRGPGGSGGPGGGRPDGLAHRGGRGGRERDAGEERGDWHGDADGEGRGGEYEGREEWGCGERWWWWWWWWGRGGGSGGAGLLGCRGCCWGRVVGGWGCGVGVMMCLLDRVLI